MFGVSRKPPVGEVIELKIQGMHCPSCAMNIDGVLEDTPGVISAETSYARAVTKLRFHPEQATVKKLIKLILQAGYVVLVK